MCSTHPSKMTRHERLKRTRASAKQTGRSLGEQLAVENFLWKHALSGDELKSVFAGGDKAVQEFAEHGREALPRIKAKRISKKHKPSH